MERKFKVWIDDKLIGDSLCDDVVFVNTNFKCVKINETDKLVEIRCYTEDFVYSEKDLGDKVEVYFTKLSDVPDGATVIRSFAFYDSANPLVFNHGLNKWEEKDE